MNNYADIQTDRVFSTWLPEGHMKARRQGVILELVDLEALHSQEQLRRRLHQRGFDATQATISRDIADLGLVKRAGDGAYQRPGLAGSSIGARPGSPPAVPHVAPARCACARRS